MSLQERRYIDPVVIAGMPRELGLPPETLGLLDTVDLKSGKNDVLLLGALESDVFDTQTKVETVSRLYDAIFDDDEIDRYDQDRVGRFFKTATKLYKDKDVRDALRQTLYDHITPILLEDVALESSLHRWRQDNTEATLNAYCTFQTIERKYNEEKARTIYRKITKELVDAREFDIMLERAEGVVSTEGRGAVIYLGVRGAEMAQTVTKHAFRTTCQENQAQAVVAPYYRDHVLTTNLGEDSEDPKGDLLSIDETIANLCRVEGGTRSGIELNLASKINKNGKISIFPAIPNVGGHILAASGYADALRLDAIRKNGIFYERPQRANAYRNIQIKNTEAAVLISMGDGAYPELLSALEYQANNRLPVVNFLQNNSVAIGVEANEVVAQGELWQKGHGKEIPGIRIKETDIEGMYLAVQFATQRAILDAGPTIIEAMTRRLLPHSNAHGDHFISEKIKKLMQVVERLSENDPRRQAIESFIKNNLIQPTRNDNQLRFKNRLKDSPSLNLLDEPTKEEIATIINNIVDPVRTSLSYLKDNEYITEDEVEIWEREAKDKMENTLQEVLTRPKPNPDHATSNTRLETRRTTVVESSSKKVRLNISEAIRLAIKEAMEMNRNVLLRGVDVYKGLSIRKEGNTIGEIHQGGYFNQTEGLFELFARDPGRLHNTAIAELDVAKYNLGMSTTPTTPQALKDAFRVLVDFQYADYGIEAWPAWHVLGHVLYTTGGKITRPTGVLLPSGAVAGGGPMHSHEVAGKALQTPSSVDVFYTSDPETTYKLLRYCLLYENNPYIFMVDKTRIFQKQEFEIGTGFFEPGRGRVVKEGNGIQIIGIGPMVNKAISAVEKLEDQKLKESIGIFEPVSLRPFPDEDLGNYLADGTGPVIVTHEETLGQGVGNRIASMLEREDSELHNTVKDRPIYVIASKDVPVPPCDGNLMNAVVPTADDIKKFILALSEKSSFI